MVFPETMMPLAVGQPRSVHLIDDILRGDKQVGLVAVQERRTSSCPGPDDVYTVGVLATIQKMIKAPDGTLRIIAQGIRRIEIERVHRRRALPDGRRCSDLPDVVEPGTELEALQRNLVSVYTKIIQLVPYLPDELEMAAANIDDPAALGYFIASTMRLKTEDKQELLEEVDLSKRLRRLTTFMNRELEVLELGSKIQDQVQSEMDKTQREYFLRQQLKAIQDELGETDETQAEVNELRERIEEANLPEEVDKQARRELDRLSKLPPAAAEYGVIRTYLDWIVSLPWSVLTDGQPGHRPRPRGPRRGPLRPGRRQGPHPRVPGRAEAQGRGHRAPSSASPALPAWARPAWARASPGPWAASSSASAWAACATSPRSAATGAPTSAPCPAPSSGPSATPAAATRCS